MTKICSWLGILTLYACSSGQDTHLQLKLPKSLREISGLAMISDTRLLAVADEKAQIYSIDFDTLDASKFATIGEPAAQGDFEGIALMRDWLYLVTSTGELWRRELTATPANYDRFDTGLGRQCEVEGLAAWQEKDILLILCKTTYSKTLRGMLAIFAWSVETQALDPSLAIIRPYKAMGVRKLHPTGITLSADRQRLFIVAGPEQYFIETTLDGDFVRGARLPNARTHRQTEGVVITSNNTLYLADEGGKGRGTVTQYEPSF